MLQLTFQAKILVPVVAIIGTVIVAASWSVNNQLAAQAEQDSAEKLSTSAEAFQNSLRQQASALEARCAVLANEPRTRAVFINNDRKTTEKHLAGLSDEFNAQALIYLSTDPSSPSVAFSKSSTVAVPPLNVVIPLANRALEGKPAGEILTIGKNLYNAVAIPINVSGSPIGALVLEFPITDSSMAEFRGLTQCEIALLSGGEVLASTLRQPELNAEIANLAPFLRTNPQRAILASQHYVALSGTLPKAGSAGYVLLASYENSLRSIASARSTLVATSMGGLLLASGLAWVIIRRVTSPLRDLRKGAEAIGRGDFSQHVAVRSQDEFGKLAAAFNGMTENLKSSRAELEKTVETIRRTESMYHRAISASGAIPYLRSHAAGHFTYIGECIETLTGFRPNEITPAAWEFMVQERLFRGELAGKSEAEAARAIRSREIVNYRSDCRILTRDGRIRWVADAAVEIFDESGKPTGSIGTLLDITDRKDLEDQLRQAQKMDAFGQLAGGIAHDFNNILTVISAHVDLLQSGGTKSKQDRESLDELAFASERAANLTRQLLTFSRKQVMQVNNVDLNRIVEDLAKMLRRIIGEDVDLVCELTNTPTIVRADTGMMEQVLMNLAVNARDAMPKGGRLTIRSIVEVLAHGRGPLLSPQEGPFVHLSVTDTGVGMTPEIQMRIFEPFFTTKGVGKGTGLGLATVYGIVNQHQGWIEVFSEPGKGTSFELYFPMATNPDASQGDRQEPDLEPIKGGTETILIAEDEHAVRKLAKTILETHGYRVVEAVNGIEALDQVRTNTTHVDMLLTDMVMPGGISGDELARRLQFVRPGLAVAFTTGYSEASAGLGEGSHFLQKPYSSRQLLETVRNCLDADRTTR